jgi:hypothetical protein
MRTRLFAVAALAALAACDSAPTAAKAPSSPRHLLNQAPVAAITYTRHPFTGYMRYYLNGTGSYDPDGTIASYFWANNCPPAPESSASTTTLDVPYGTSCSVTLEVWDNEGAFGSKELIFSN